MSQDQNSETSLKQIVDVQRTQRDDLRLLGEHVGRLGNRILAASIVSFALFAIFCAAAAYLWVRTTTKHFSYDLARATRHSESLQRRVDALTTQQRVGKTKRLKNAERIVRYFELFLKGQTDKALALQTDAVKRGKGPLARAVVAFVSRGLRLRSAQQEYAHGLAEMEEKHYKTAAKHLLSALRYAPDGPLAGKIHYRLGLAYYQSSHFRDAAEHFEAVTRQEPKMLDDSGLFRLAHAHDILKEEPAARRYYKQLLERFPHSEYAAIVKGKLRQLSHR
ncbi:MAG: tetratricopeptide repeat protein [Deltaproteobacteria bacterium]|nr:tetratricopeptide repeat protein [Deltaproteobacteria bacterium]